MKLHSAEGCSCPPNVNMRRINGEYNKFKKKKNSLDFLHKSYNSKIVIMQIIQYYLFRRIIFIYLIQCILCD
jgi:hypothetical protein